jgi:hypothetical protein
MQSLFISSRLGMEFFKQHCCSGRTTLKISLQHKTTLKQQKVYLLQVTGEKMSLLFGEKGL